LYSRLFIVLTVSLEEVAVEEEEQEGMTYLLHVILELGNVIKDGLVWANGFRGFIHGHLALLLLACAVTVHHGGEEACSPHESWRSKERQRRAQGLLIPFEDVLSTSLSPCDLPPSY
jgi:hypothetical protein